MPVWKRDDVRGGALESFPELLGSQSELVDSSYKGGDVDAELFEFFVLIGDCVFQFDDGGAEAGFESGVAPHSLTC